uniref:Orf126 protein n=1 Tax=Methanosarcina mazei TaxID=2209 RepID=O53139_METMZ|nr:Orf126 [Methanosarcina mazei]
MNSFCIGDCKDNIPVRKRSSEKYRPRRHTAGCGRRKCTFIPEPVTSVQDKTSIFKGSNPYSGSPSSAHCNCEFPDTFTKPVNLIYGCSYRKRSLGSGTETHVVREISFNMDFDPLSFRNYSFCCF